MAYRLQDHLARPGPPTGPAAPRPRASRAQAERLARRHERKLCAARLKRVAREQFALARRADLPAPIREALQRRASNLILAAALLGH